MLVRYFLWDIRREIILKEYCVGILTGICSLIIPRQIPDFLERNMEFFRESSGRNQVKTFRSIFFLFLATIFAIIGGCGEEKVIIRYLEVPPPVELVSPPVDTFVTEGILTFLWSSSEEAVRYQLQVSSSDNFISRTIDIETTDTSYVNQSELVNDSYFWRVRGENGDGLKGDWSDAEIWTFHKSDYVNYMDLASSIKTVGTAQDVFVRGDTAYVADGQADLTIVNISDKYNPSIIRNIDTTDDDFAKAVYIAPGDTVPYAFVADMDGKIQAIHVRDTTFIFNNSIGFNQNLEDLTGVIRTDTLWLFAVSSGFGRRKLSYYQITYDPIPVEGMFGELDMPADANGVWADLQYAYVACGVAGLMIVDVDDILNPSLLSSYDLEGSALSVDVDGNYAYIAADRAGFYIVDTTDKSNPVIATQINTSGRANDVHIVGDYAFIADASSGLKVVDVSIPHSAHLVATYDTPYAYGVWADSDFIYLCDRDEGLMIFENLVTQ